MVAGSRRYHRSEHQPLQCAALCQLCELLFRHKAHPRQPQLRQINNCPVILGYRQKQQQPPKYSAQGWIGLVQFPLLVRQAHKRDVLPVENLF